VAINKFFHTVLSGWVLGAVVVAGIAAWYMLKKKNAEFARQSMKVAAMFGLVSSLLILWTGHGSAQQVAEKQPMKLAVMEGLYEGGEGVGLIAFAIPNPAKESYNDNVDPYILNINIPKGLSWLSFGELDAYVPGIKDIIDGGYKEPDGSTALSFVEKQSKGKLAIQALADYKKAKKDGNEAAATEYKNVLKANYAYFGYGYLETPDQLIPNIPLVFWPFHIMVYLGGYFILLFIVLSFLVYRNKDIENKKWLLWACVWTIPLAYVAGQAGWMVAEIGRQPWAIQDVLPLQAAVSALSAKSVIITFCLFLALFTGLLIAEIRIMLNQIKKGPEDSH
jgi:cytochrome d ubiquinol oxidase subunit I